MLASFNLPIPTVQKALTAVTKLLGVTATGGTGAVAADAERHKYVLHHRTTSLLSRPLTLTLACWESNKQSRLCGL